MIKENLKKVLILGVFISALTSCISENDVTPEIVVDSYLFQTVDDDGVVTDSINVYAISNVEIASATTTTPFSSELDLVPYYSSIYSSSLDTENQGVESGMAVGDYNVSVTLSDGTKLTSLSTIGNEEAAPFLIISSTVVGDDEAIALEFTESIDAGAYSIQFIDSKNNLVYSSGYILPEFNDQFIGDDLEISVSDYGWTETEPAIGAVESVVIAAVIFDDPDNPSEYEIQAKYKVGSLVE